MKDFTNSENERDFDWAEMLHVWVFRARIVLRRLWWVFLLTISAGIGYQAYKHMNTELLYESRARMILDGRIELPEGANFVEVFANFWGTQIQLMTSPMVQQRARERVRALHPELPDNARARVHVTHAPDANIFNLTSVGRDRLYTQYFLDAVMFEYFNYKKERRAQTQETTFISIMEKLTEYQQQIEELEQQRLDFQRENNIVFLKEQGSNAGAALAQLNSRAVDLRSQLRLLEQMGLSEDTDASLVDSPLLEVTLSESDADYAQSRRSLERLKAEFSEFSLYMRPKHPRIIELTRDIERQENMLNIHRRQSVRQLHQRKQQLEKQLIHLNALITEQEKEALKFSRLLAEFERIGSRLASVQNLHDRLSQSIQRIDLSQDLDQEIVSVMESATTAYQPPGDIVRQIVTGAIAGFALGAGILFLFAILDNRLISVDDLTSRFESPVLGIIPIQKQADGKVDMLKSDDDRMMFAESCRNIRSSLLFMDREGPHPKTILITSSVPSEGKSTLTGNLAITLAFASARILAVDADMRRGHMHQSFGIPNNAGLAGLLRDHSMKPADVIQHTEVEGLDIITCGDYPERPGELLMSKRFNELFDGLKDRYDYILYDCPPVLATDDTPSFATKADAVLFVVRSNYTRNRQIKNAVNILNIRGVKIQGFILNFVDSREPSHYYYKYYDYYSYQSYKPGAGREEEKTRQKAKNKKAKG